MQVRLRTAGVVAIGGALLAMSGVLVAQVEPSQDSTPAGASQETVAVPRSRLAGQWHLNKELSTLPRTSTSEEPSAPPGGGSGGGARRPGGGGGGGYGGRGGFGGRGGSGGAGGYGGSPQVMPEDALKMRALMRVLAEPAEMLTILVSSAEVTTTDEHGFVLKLKTDGKKQEVNFGPGAIIDTKAKWEGDVLSLELSAGSMKLTETYQVTAQPQMLAIAVQPASGKGDGGHMPLAPMKFVYGRGE